MILPSCCCCYCCSAALFYFIFIIRYLSTHPRAFNWHLQEEGRRGGKLVASLANSQGREAGGEGKGEQGVEVKGIQVQDDSCCAANSLHYLTNNRRADKADSTKHNKGYR